MSMEGKAQIKVDAILAAGVSKKLQTQLDSIARRDLKLNIGQVKIQNKQFNQSMQKAMKQVAKTSNTTSQAVVKQNQKNIDSIDKLISRYKKRNITFKEFDKYASKMMASDKFRNKSMAQQQKLTDALTSAEKKQGKQLMETQRVRNAVNKQHEKGLKRIETIQRNITNKQIQSGDKAFQDKGVIASQQKLNQMMASFGKEGGASLKQINSQYADLNTNIKRSTKAIREQNYSFGNMAKEALKGMLLWSNKIYNKFININLTQRSVYRVICI